MICLRPAIFLFLAAGLQAANNPASLKPVDIIAREGSLNVSDGSSLYLFNQDGSFHSFPVGMSGRTIEGRWAFQPGSEAVVIIEGRWGWLNGLSPLDDFRTMKLVLYPREGESEMDCPPIWKMPAGGAAAKPAGSQSAESAVLAVAPHRMKVHACYFLIEEIVRQSARSGVK